ncbi:MAG: hypothetical protein IT450_11095 [Phycisphaerales bacterium]|nr:hypothetical protein [Phycisphaerales bacterium]
MPRSIREILPTSSVARLLDSGAAGRAVAPSGADAAFAAAAAPGMRSHEAEGRPPSRTRPIKREVLLTPDADTALDTLIQIFREASGARLTASYIARALLLAAHAAAPEIRRAAQQLGPQSLPSNAPGHEAARQRFEQRLARALAGGISAASMRKD